ncbi:MAG TPA: 4-vinyl reductase [Thermotogota bacterium]|nr:4-vinyl reductase [Thermotogota bacterium]HRW93256.1 4-vinyl reductase [Thermotogota bacterium]
MAIDKKVIFNGVSQMQFVGNQKGLIDVFGVYLTSGSSTMYNNLSFELIRKLDPALIAEAETILTNAARVCGYNTFYGIQNSVEWEGLIAPMVDNDTDRLIASVEICNALGWARWELVDVVPGKKAVFRAHKGYEAELYVKKYGPSKRSVCYMMQGVASALNDLSYGGEYPSGIYAFETVETMCRAKGDPYCEFVTTRVE